MQFNQNLNDSLSKNDVSENSNYFADLEKLKSLKEVEKDNFNIVTIDSNNEISEEEDDSEFISHKNDLSMDQMRNQKTNNFSSLNPKNNKNGFSYFSQTFTNDQTQKNQSDSQKQKILTLNYDQVQNHLTGIFNDNNPQNSSILVSQSNSNIPKEGLNPYSLLGSNTDSISKVDYISQPEDSFSFIQKFQNMNLISSSNQQHQTPSEKLLMNQEIFNKLKSQNDRNNRSNDINEYLGQRMQKYMHKRNMEDSEMTEEFNIDVSHPSNIVKEKSKDNDKLAFSQISSRKKKRLLNMNDLTGSKTKNEQEIAQKERFKNQEQYNIPKKPIANENDCINIEESGSSSQLTQSEYISKLSSLSKMFKNFFDSKLFQYSQFVKLKKHFSLKFDLKFQNPFPESRIAKLDQIKEKHGICDFCESLLIKGYVCTICTFKYCIFCLLLFSDFNSIQKSLTEQNQEEPDGEIYIGDCCDFKSLIPLPEKNRIYFDSNPFLYLI